MNPKLKERWIAALEGEYDERYANKWQDKRALEIIDRLLEHFTICLLYTSPSPRD